MQKYINILLFTVIIGLVVYFFVLPKQKLYTKNLFYMDTYIEVEIYSKDAKKALKALDEVNNIYKEYHELSDRYTAYNVVNVYDINNHFTEESEIIIDKKLYDLIKYGVDWYVLSGGLLNINMGSVIDVWKEFKEEKIGVPTLDTLKKLDTDIKKVVLLENGRISNDNPSIDLGALAKGYATEEVGKYLRGIGLTKFLINAGGNVLAGDHYDAGVYKIGIENPNDRSSIYQVVKGNNIAIVTSGGYERYFEYEGVKYNHIIDPNTLMPANNMKAVTVITKDSALGDVLSTTLFLMSVEDGLEFIKDFEAEAIWYTNNDEVIKTEGFSQYE